uniref:Uncharacterized protein n=1 Tax=Nelumbo nucifera TaxID=4432 RepID=A0A822ZTU3_NELNU|nr:TPA_asm: hypothetical protein HUJ06_018308 [Nelumbo nucifera]DAD48373.1 TPA_asm: hypothetical protein HUJ06_018310 [Nelumbo nucifera]
MQLLPVNNLLLGIPRTRNQCLDLCIVQECK